MITLNSEEHFCFSFIGSTCVYDLTVWLTWVSSYAPGHRRYRRGQHTLQLRSLTGPCISCLIHWCQWHWLVKLVAAPLPPCLRAWDKLQHEE